LWFCVVRRLRHVLPFRFRRCMNTSQIEVHAWKCKIFVSERYLTSVLFEIWIFRLLLLPI
jgi:hypothetical protein